MTDIQVRFINMLQKYAVPKGWKLELPPTASTNGLWIFRFTDSGANAGTVEFFDDQVTAEGAGENLSRGARRRIDEALA